MDILELVKAAFALFAIVDPVGVIPIFLLATHGYTLAQSRAAARIRHPNVVPTLDVVAMSGEVFIVMEYVPGDSLGALWRAHKVQLQTIPIAYSEPKISLLYRANHEGR